MAADGTPVSAVLPTGSSGSTAFPVSYTSGGQLVQVGSDLSKYQWIAPTVQGTGRLVPVIKPVTAVSGLVRIDSSDSKGSLGQKKSEMPQKYVLIQNPIVPPAQQHQVWNPKVYTRFYIPGNAFEAPDFFEMGMSFGQISRPPKFPE